jgi:UDP-glucose 4-epimerase
MTRHVLVTGAAGFLGRAFARHHLGAGDDVFGIDDLSSPHAFWPEELPHDRRTQTDAGEWFAAQDPARRFDLAYHFAAPVGGRLKIEGDPLFNADSLRLDSLFFRWAVGQKVPTVVYPSSSAVYGVNFQTEVATILHEGLFDATNTNWFAPDEMYGFTKLVGEFLASKAATYGLNTLCLRPFSGYGEEQSLEYPVPSIALRAAKREDPLVIWGSGDQTRDFVHVSDLVGATVARLEAGVVGYVSMNIGSGVATSFRAVAGILADLAGYAPVIVSDETKPQGVLNRRGDNQLMLRFYQPKVELREGLGRVLEAMKAHSTP